VGLQVVVGLRQLPLCWPFFAALANVHLVCKDQQQCLFRIACIKLLTAVLSINSNAQAAMWHC
jgi:hypothetical protein